MFPAWLHNRDENNNTIHLICNACRQSIFIKDQKIRLGKIYKSKQIYFKTKCINIGYEPRVGVCNWCRAVAGFDTKSTHMHHEVYDSNDFTKNTIELCISCHRIETIRVRQMQIIRDKKTGRIISLIYNK